MQTGPPPEENCIGFIEDEICGNEIHTAEIDRLRHVVWRTIEVSHLPSVPLLNLGTDTSTSIKIPTIGTSSPPYSGGTISPQG